MLHPEKIARIAIDKQLTRAGWEIVSREEYTPDSIAAVGIRSEFLEFVSTLKGCNITAWGEA